MADRLLVVFSAFAPLALEEANLRITDAEIDALHARLSNPALWKIHRRFGQVVFMLYTEHEAAEHERAGLRKTYADLYFVLLRGYDRFDYLRREAFDITFGSKEDFDKNYQGHWLYYDR